MTEMEPCPGGTTPGPETPSAAAHRKRDIDLPMVGMSFNGSDTITIDLDLEGVNEFDVYGHPGEGDPTGVDPLEQNAEGRYVGHYAYGTDHTYTLTTTFEREGQPVEAVITVQIPEAASQLQQEMSLRPDVDLVVTGQNENIYVSTSEDGQTYANPRNDQIPSAQTDKAVATLRIGSELWVAFYQNGAQPQLRLQSKDDDGNWGAAFAPTGLPANLVLPVSLTSLGATPFMALVDPSDGKVKVYEGGSDFQSWTLRVTLGTSVSPPSIACTGYQLMVAYRNSSNGIEVSQTTTPLYWSTPVVAPVGTTTIGPALVAITGSFVIAVVDGSGTVSTRYNLDSQGTSWGPPTTITGLATAHPVGLCRRFETLNMTIVDTQSGVYMCSSPDAGQTWTNPTLNRLQGTRQNWATNTAAGMCGSASPVTI